MASWYDIDPNDTQALYRNWEEQNAPKPGTAAPGFDIWGMPLPAAPAAPAPAPAAPAALTSAQQSAKASIDATLGSFGLKGLGDWAWSQFLNGSPTEQIMLDLRARPEYQTRFAGMKALSDKGRAISESAYIDLERTYVQLYKTAGLPASFYDSPDDFARLIGGEVAPTEIRDRLQMASAAAYQAPAETREELARLYGVDQGALTAYYLDPDKTLPLLQQQFAAGTLSSSARRSGYGALNREEAERLASLGITEAEASKGFGELTRSKELFGALPGEAGSGVARSEQLGVLEGNAAAIAKLNKKAEERRAAFGGGGGYASGQRGVSGLGSAQA